MQNLALKNVENTWLRYPKILKVSINSELSLGIDIVQTIISHSYEKSVNF